MTTSRSPAELVALRKAAQELSTQRRERLSTIHLLAVAARAESPAAELFSDRRLDQDAILKAARGISDEGPEAIGRAMSSAREIAKRSVTPEPSAVHLVLALLADRSCAALRALIDLGVDAGRLRASAMALAQGVVAARRITAHAPLRSPSLGDAPTPTRSMPITDMHARRTPEPPSASSSTSAARASSTKTPHAAKGPSLSNSSPPPPRSATSPGVTVPLLPPLVAKRPAPRAEAITARAQEPEAAPAKGGAPVIPLPKRAAASAPKLADPARFALDKERFPMLSALGKNLTQMAAEGTLRPAIGRTREIEGVLDVLAKRHASSACIVGPAGVGKTTVVHGVAHRMVALAAAGEPPRAVIELSVPQLMAGTGLRGALAEKVATMCAETRDSEGSVVLHGNKGGPLDLGGGLLPPGSKFIAKIAKDGSYRWARSYEIGDGQFRDMAVGSLEDETVLIGIYYGDTDLGTGVFTGSGMFLLKLGK